LTSPSPRLELQQLAFSNIDMQHRVEPANATVWVGPSSAEGKCPDFVIAK